MRIAFNAQLLSYRPTYRSAGIARYIDRILAHLPGALGPGDQVSTYVGPEIPAGVPAVAWSRVARSRLPTHRAPVRIIWEHAVFPILARAWGADLVHAPAHVLPAGLGCATVVTFHDLGFYLLPEALPPGRRRYLQTFARAAVRRADRIIAVSEATRRDLVEVLGAAADHVDVVHNGVDERFRPETDRAALERFRSARGLPERFILYLGTLEPRKNLPNLLRAYAIARRRGVTEPLVVAGGPGWGDLALARLIDELDLRAAVRLVGYVPTEEQPRWYAAATLFAFPSRYEGFGLPALEAMACGTAVVASDRSALPEVVGDAGLLVDPDDPEVLAAALAEVMRDEDRRRELARRGLSRAGRFRWDVAARETVETYRAALVAPRALRLRARDYPAGQTVE